MDFSIKILGSNSSVPAYGRFHTSQFVTIGKEKLLIDCGEGAQYQLQKFGWGLSGIDKIFISHLHGDHFLGLMGILYSMHLNGREKDLILFGQFGLNDIITTQLKYSGSVLNFKIDFRVLDDSATKNLLIDTKDLSIYSFPLKHRLPCCGFLIKEKSKKRKILKDKIPEGFPVEYYHLLLEGEDIVENGQTLFKNSELTTDGKKPRSYAFCSDTAYKEDIVETIYGVNILYHETTFLHEMKEWASKTLHSTTIEAAKIAKLAQVDKLVIGHYSARYKDISPFVKEAQSVFPNTYPAVEGETFEIDE